MQVLRYPKEKDLLYPNMNKIVKCPLTNFKSYRSMEGWKEYEIFWIISSILIEENKLFYHINTDEISSHVKITLLSSHVKISPLLWLHNKSRISHQKTIKWNGFVFHSSCWKYNSLVCCAYSWNILQHSKRNFVSPSGHVISSIFYNFVVIVWLSVAYA